LFFCNDIDINNDNLVTNLIYTITFPINEQLLNSFLLVFLLFMEFLDLKELFESLLFYYSFHLSFQVFFETNYVVNHPKF